jgi:cardiolipin synthase
MKDAANAGRNDRAALPQLRELADQMFSRAAGAPLIGGNHVDLLEDGRENYAAWLEAIRRAKSVVHFENYFLRDDEVGREFADAFMAAARAGARVRILCDWMGGFGKVSRQFWKTLHTAGAEIRIFNPPQFSSPLGWLSRNHRKSLMVDGDLGFVAGLCVGREWLGDPGQGIAPWRDTGVAIRGPAVAAIARAFARSWSLAGAPLPGNDPIHVPASAGDVSLRIVSSEPATAGMLRLDQLVASIARSRLWLTDAYYSGISTYVQALKAAAQDGVDVRLLVPHATDIPLLKPFSRAGYQALLEAGVRVFEWNGSMLHAKTAVADGRWARVGSTNLNLASWLGNCELDTVVEDVAFATKMEQLYLRDLGNSTELILDERRKLRAPGQPPRLRHAKTRGSGSASGVAAGALRIGYVMGAAVTRHRVVEASEWRVLGLVGLGLCALSGLVLAFPRVLAYPVAALGIWGGLALLWKTLRRKSTKR